MTYRSDFNSRGQGTSIDSNEIFMVSHLRMDNQISVISIEELVSQLVDLLAGETDENF